MNSLRPSVLAIYSQLLHIILLCVFAIGGALTSSLSFASKYTPEGIYEPTIYHLKNGMRVILNPRHGARNVAIRLNVGIGNFDFLCDKQESAHFLEHLLFTGTSQHTEVELDELITQHGGDWNAYTYNEDTEYEIDIFSEHTNVALSTLGEIISDSVITPEDFDFSRTIIYRELGGKPSKIRQFLYRHEIVSTAGHKSRRVLLKGNRSYCSSMDKLEHITIQDILDAYEYFYVPNNMTLVIVGDFETKTIRDQIQQVFGKLKKKKLKRDIPVAQDYKDGPEYFSSSLKPIIGENSKTGLIYRTNGYSSADYYTLLVIKAYLADRLYESIRVDEGLTYAPTAELSENSKDGFFRLSAETTTKSMENVSKLMLKEINQFRDGGVSDEEISKTIKSLLRSWARGLESNSSIANYYLGNLDELNKYGKFIDQESYIEGITPQDVRTVAKRYFLDSNMAIVEASPTLTYNQFYLLLGITIISLLFLTWRLMKKMSFHISINKKTASNEHSES